MKRAGQNIKYLFAFLFLILASCGGGGSGEKAPATSIFTNAGLDCTGSPLIGTWSGAILGESDVMNFKNDCSVTSTYCAATAKVQNVSSSSGNLNVVVTSTSNKPGCLPAGATTCGYIVTGNTLQFSCLGGTLTYIKQ